MPTITPAQLKCLNTLISKYGISKEDKETLVYSFSNGRVISSKDLSFNEAAAMIKHLKATDPNERMRKKVFALAYEAGLIWGETPADKKMNSIKLNQFLKERGTVKKELDKMSGMELTKVVTQFEYIIKHIKQTGANKATRNLLEELSIPTSNGRSKG